jgi:hypothetical protein
MAAILSAGVIPYMFSRKDLAHGEPVQTEFAWADDSRVEPALAESSLVESTPLESVPVEAALPEPAQSKVSDPIAAPAPATPAAPPKRPASERRLAANRANAQKSERSGRSFTFWTGHIVYIRCQGSWLHSLSSLLRKWLFAANLYSLERRTRLCGDATRAPGSSAGMTWGRCSAPSFAKSILTEKRKIPGLGTPHPLSIEIVLHPAIRLKEGLAPDVECPSLTSQSTPLAIREHAMGAAVNGARTLRVAPRRFAVAIASV